MKWATLENLSTTVMTTVMPLDGGRPVTKYIAMCDQVREGTDSGWSNPAGGQMEPFPAAQTRQANTNKWTSRTTDGHQNCCLINMQVQVVPGWQASLEWPHL